MRANKKDSIATWSAVGMLVWGVILTSASFIVPHTGQVHESVLWNLLQILIFCGSIFYIVTYTKIHLAQRSRNMRLCSFVAPGRHRTLNRYQSFCERNTCSSLMSDSTELLRPTISALPFFDISART